jgi:uncharacterized membrane protein
MKRLFHAIWSRGILSTFLTGLLALLPLVITVAIIVWVAGYLLAWFGPDSFFYERLTDVGRRVAPGPVSETIATAIGAALVLAAIWTLGLLVKNKARHRFDLWWSRLVERVPVVSSVYGTASKVVGMLKKDDQADLTAMSVVYCAFGAEGGGGILGLLASPETYRFAGRGHRLVYIPTSPIPMSGGILLIPSANVHEVDMTAEQLMRIYFSMGILAPEVVPKEHRAEG